MNREISLHTIALYNGTEYELENLLNSLLYKIDQLEQELQRKDNNWNELKEWLNEPQITYNLDATEFGIEKIECVSVKDILDKIKDIENGNK